MMTGWLAVYNEVYHDNLDVEAMVSWNVCDHVKPECGRNLYSLLSCDVIANAPIRPHARNVIKHWLDLGHNVFCVSASYRQHIHTKKAWLQHNLPELSNRFIVTHNKKVLNLDVLIDDGTHNFGPNITHPILFDRPWNRRWMEEPENLRIVFGWYDLRYVMEDIICRTQ